MRLFDTSTGRGAMIVEAIHHAHGKAEVPRAVRGPTNGARDVLPMRVNAWPASTTTRCRVPALHGARQRAWQIDALRRPFA